MEFVIDRNGRLLAGWEWANPGTLKNFLEEKIGPSGISEKEWQRLSDQTKMMTSLADNDEVPGTEVPRPALTALDVKRIGEGEAPPFSLEAGTLPPEITPGGLCRLYLTITPEMKREAYFDSGRAPVVALTEARGISLKKDRIKAGKRRRIKDIHPHAMGVAWERDPDTRVMAFTAEVTAWMGLGEGSVREYTARFRFEGPIPEIRRGIDEILPGELPATGFAARRT